MKLKQVRVTGYKNLIDCKIDLGDFNVIVGPNNCGKSNFLELFMMFFMLCYGTEKVRRNALSGFQARFMGTSIPYLTGQNSGKMTLGFTLEINIGKDIWIVNYDLEIHRYYRDLEKSKFLTENLTAKKRSSTGKAKNYISRKGKKYKLIKKERPIAESTSVLQVIENVYPEFKGLPSELSLFMNSLACLALNHTLALSPEGLRNSFGEKTDYSGPHISSFDLNLIIEKINKKKKNFDIFRNTVTDILDLDDVKLATRETQLEDQEGKRVIEKQGVCIIKSRDVDYKSLQDYSDGTFNVVAIVAHIISGKNLGPLICVEELENCLHPSALKKLILFLRDNSKKWPVLITTHSPYVLNEVNPTDINVMVTDETGATHFEKLKDRRTINAILNNKYMSFGDFLPSNFGELIGSK